MMKKFALALLLALSTGTLAPAAAGHTLHARGTPVDGVYRRAEEAGRTKRKVAARRRGRGRMIRAKSIHVFGPGPTLPDVTEIDADGLRKLLQRGEGNRARPLLVNFWATWCVPCRKEFPDLVKIQAEYRMSGIDFALVSADDVEEIKTTVPKFLREMRATEMWAYLLNAADTEAAIAQVDPEWGGQLPATFLFDRQGKLVYRHFGIINPAKLREEIDKVTGDK